MFFLLLIARCLSQEDSIFTSLYSVDDVAHIRESCAPCSENYFAVGACELIDDWGEWTHPLFFDAASECGELCPFLMYEFFCPAVMENEATIKTVTINGAERDYILRLPNGYSEDITYPVVFLWHGLGDSANQIWNSGKNFRTFADNNNIILVYPNGRRGTFPPYREVPLRSWPYAWPMTWDPSDATEAENSEDMVFTEHMVNDVIENYGGDSEKIYAWGWSNGAIWMARVMCESNLFTKAALWVGNFGNKYVSLECANEDTGIWDDSKCTFEDWEQMPDFYTCDEFINNPRDVLIMNGLSDGTQPWAGSVSDGFPPVSYFTDAFNTMAACEPQDSANTRVVGTFGNDVCYSDTGCAVNVTLCASAGGHYKTDRNRVTWDMDFELGSMEFFCQHGGCQLSCREGNECDLPSIGDAEYLPLEPSVRNGVCLDSSSCSAYSVFPCDTDISIYGTDPMGTTVAFYCPATCQYCGAEESTEGPSTCGCGEEIGTAFSNLESELQTQMAALMSETLPAQLDALLSVTLTEQIQLALAAALPERFVTAEDFAMLEDKVGDLEMDNNDVMNGMSDMATCMADIAGSMGGGGDDSYEMTDAPAETAAPTEYWQTIGRLLEGGNNKCSTSDNDRAFRLSFTSLENCLTRCRDDDRCQFASTNFMSESSTKYCIGCINLTQAADGWMAYEMLNDRRQLSNVKQLSEIERLRAENQRLRAELAEARRN